MIVLYQMPAVWGIPNLSLFCSKLEAYLRLTKLPYESRAASLPDSPKGKAPYAEIDGRVVGDSQLIIEHLKKVHGDPLDAHLSAEARARGHMIRRTLEEGTYWVTIHSRWNTDEGWAVMGPLIRHSVPDDATLENVRQYMIGQGRSQGTLRHTHDEIMEMGKADIASLVPLLGDQQFILGNSPTSFDATIYAVLAAILGFPAPSALKSFTASQANLTAYFERMRKLCFPEMKPLL